MKQQNFLPVFAGRLVHILLFILALILSGCANQQTRTETDRMELWESHRNHVAGIKHWELAGRMAVRLDEDAWSASLFWKQTGDEFEIRIIAPLAQGSALITGNGDRVSLTTSDNRDYSDNDVHRIMKQNLGWSIPVNALKYWVRGITRPGHSSNNPVIDENGRLVSIQQDNWEVSFQRYDLTTENALPSRIELTRAGTRVRVIINRWSVKS